MFNKSIHWLTLLLILSLCGCASTAMETAINRGDCESLKTLIAQKEDVNAVSSCNTTLLLWSVLKVNWDCVQILLDNGADPNIPDCLGTTPMLWVARIGNINIVKDFIDKGANVNTPNDDKNTPLLYATYNPDIEVIKLLVAHGANVNAVNKDGDNALLFIANNVAENISTMDRQHFDAYKDIWDYLVDKGVDPYQMNKYGKSASSYIDLYPVYCQKFGECSAAKARVPSDPEVIANVKKLEDSKNIEGLEQYLDKHPAAVELIQGYALRLSMYGPSKLRVLDIQKYLKKGMGQKVVMAQINASKSPYKIFTPDEASFLQAQGIPEDIIAAMITRTASIEEEQDKDAKAQQALQQQALQQQTLQQQAIQQQAAQQNQSQPQGQTQPQTAGQAAVQEATNQAVKILIDHFNPFK